MKYTIREMKCSEYPLLEEFLYQAIFVPQGSNPPPRSILDDPELKIYREDFGAKQDDHALVALVNQKVVGAICVRIIHDYGHVDDETPSLSMSVLKEYRGCGLGSALLKEMLSYLKKKGYTAVSLSVQKENPAVGLYRDAGFYVHQENAHDYVMLCRL